MQTADCLKLGCVSGDYIAVVWSDGTYGPKTFVCKCSGKLPECGPCGKGLENELEKPEPIPEFYLYFLKIPGYKEYTPCWIRIDQVHSVKADRIVPDDQEKPVFYRVRVNDSGTITETPSRKDADALVERIMSEVSMRLSNLYGLRGQSR